MRAVRAPIAPALALCLLTMAGAPAAVLAQSDGLEEYQVKVAFLYHFTQFVEWPADTFGGAHEPMTICVVGNDPSDGFLEATVKNKAASGHPLRVRYVKSADGLPGCHLVFVPSWERKRWGRMGESVRETPVLTVGEGSDFTQTGGVIGLTTDSNKVRFEINLECAERARLKVSSKLLALAKVVHYGMRSDGR